MLGLINNFEIIKIATCSEDFKVSLKVFNPNQMLGKIVAQPAIHGFSQLAARALMAYIFIVAGWGKVVGYEATVGYMQAMGVPGELLPLTILLEFGGGLTILFGLQTRVVAALLAGFSLVTAFLFHGTAEDAVNFMKNFAMAGGLLLLVVQGAGRISLDALIEK